MPAAFISAASNPLAGLTETQTAHGFTVGQGIFASTTNNTWQLSQGDSAATLGTDMVAEVIDANTFRRAMEGETIGGFTGLVAGTAYGDSVATAGDIEAFDSQMGRVPGTDQNISNVMGYAESATELTFKHERAIAQ